MGKKTTETCDCCKKDVTYLDNHDYVYRGKIKAESGWWNQRQDRGEQTVCEACWKAIGDAVRAAAPVSTETAP